MSDLEIFNFFFLISGKLGNQHNGEINTSGQVNSSDDTIQSIESLQNDSLVQKIEQVLSEVLGTEPRYKSGKLKNILRSVYNFIYMSLK